MKRVQAVVGDLRRSQREPFKRGEVFQLFQEIIRSRRIAQV